MSNLIENLTQVYGLRLPMDLYLCYCQVNPLKISLPKNADGLYGYSEKYWECVSNFLLNLHSVILDQTHSLHVSKIQTDQYYFLTKMCIDRSFRIGDIINIRNDRSSQYNKTLANIISHNILPFYIINLYHRLLNKYVSVPADVSDEVRLQGDIPKFNDYICRPAMASATVTRLTSTSEPKTKPRRNAMISKRGDRIKEETEAKAEIEVPLTEHANILSLGLYEHYNPTPLLNDPTQLNVN